MGLYDLRQERGQAVVLVALLVMFAFIALTALAIDGGHIYVTRRNLQNIADAACLAAATELSLHGTALEAENAAVDYILDNGGDDTLYTPPSGSGVTLTKGIEVTGSDVRVALQHELDTYFTEIFNRSGALVGARAHCSSSAGGHLLPIAVRRFAAQEDPADQVDLLANKYADPFWDPWYGPGYPADSTPTPWNGRYGPMTIYFPTDYVPSDGVKDEDQTGAIDCDLPPKDGDHEGACVLGQGVSTNSPGSNFRGFVLLDARNIAQGPVEYYNGATGQADTNKDVSEKWFRYRYPGPLPVVGDQLGLLDGVSNKFAVDAMVEYYRVGQEFVAVVYDGYIWQSPDFDISITPLYQPITPTVADPATYEIALWKAGPAPWADNLLVTLTPYFMYETTEITTTVDFDPTPPILVPMSGATVTTTMEVYALDALTGTNYLSALTVEAYDSVLGLKDWVSTYFSYGTIASDFTMYAGALEFYVEQGDALNIDLTTRGYGFQDNNAPLRADPDGYTWSDVFTSGQLDTIKIKDGTDWPKKPPFALTVREDAPLGSYSVRLTANHGGTPERSVEVTVHVIAPSSGGDPDRFIIVQGFANFRISYIDNNTVAAYAIGPIVQDASEEITSGQVPRLLLWD